jgi:hypothetical protein
VAGAVYHLEEVKHILDILSRTHGQSVSAIAKQLKQEN